MEALIAIFFWFFLCVIVGIAANTRGRSGVGWFLLSFLISPLLAGLLMLALPRRDDMGFNGGKIIVEGERQKNPAPVAFIVLALVVLTVSAAVFMAYRIV